MDIYEAFSEAEERREERAKARAFDRVVASLKTVEDVIDNPHGYIGEISYNDALAGFKDSVKRIIKQTQKEIK